MKTYTQLRNLYGTLTNNSSSANLTLGDQLMNDEYKSVCAERDWDFLLRTNTFVTVASQQSYNFPADYGELVSVTVLVGSYQWTPIEISSATEWDRINGQPSFVSQYPQYFFVFNGTIKFWPTPSASANTVTITYRKRVTDLSIADYTTGSVSAVTNGASAVTGSGTTWTAPMVGRYLQITLTNTAGQSGDSEWYLISAVGSATTLTLTDSYQGTTISGNTTYTIGQVSALPEEFQQLPLYKALANYYTSIEPEMDRADRYNVEYERLKRGLVESYGMQTENVNIESSGSFGQINPNLIITG